MVESVLGRRPGVLAVTANPVAQTATVRFDPDRTGVAELRDWVRDCGYHCAGQSVPHHVCDPLAEPIAPAAPPHAGHEAHGPAHEMAAMVADMRNRFAVAAALSVPILLWSPIGRQVFGFRAAAPFGLRDDTFGRLLSLPVVLYSSAIFFTGAWRALRARTLDMMVLVAVVIGAGWLYSVGVTLTGGGEMFYEAASVLAAFVLLGHWFEMRARGGANDAIRTLLDLAPPRAACCAAASRSRYPRPKWRSGICCWCGPARRSRSTGWSPTASPRSMSPWSPGRACRQPQRHPAGTGRQGRRGHRAGADRDAGPAGAELQGARTAPWRTGNTGWGYSSW